MNKSRLAVLGSVLVAVCLAGTHSISAYAADASQFKNQRTSTKLAANDATAAGAKDSTAAPADPSMPKTVKVLGETLTIKNNALTEKDEFIAEYIPAGQTWDDWTTMYAVRLIPDTSLDAEASATATAERIKARKATDPVANAAVLKQDDGKSCAVDFLISAGPIIEHNVFLYFKQPKGLVSLQVARRLYAKKGENEQLKPFIMGIPQLRPQILKELTSGDLPVTKLAK